MVTSLRKRLFKTKPAGLIKRIAPYPIFYLQSFLTKHFTSIPPVHGKKGPALSREKISRLNEAYDLIENYEVISLDIFDTLITRRVHPADEPFFRNGFAAEIILSQINSDIKKNHFSRKLDSIIHKYRCHNAKKGFDFEIKIDDALESTLKELGIPEEKINDYANKLLQNQIRRECNTLHVIEGVIEFLQYCKNKNKKLIAVSDMYFSKKDIECILKACGILEFFDQIYVSSEYKVNKHSGKLFKYVIQALAIDKEKIVHIGDNFWSDVVSARKCGIYSLWINHPAQIAQKKIIGHYYSGAKPFSKFVRKKISELLVARKAEKFSDFINNYLALDICNFVFDLLHKAYMENIETIYFLERDGTLFYHLAKVFQEKIALFHGAKLIQLKRTRIPRRKAASLIDYESYDAVIARASRMIDLSSFNITAVLGTIGISVNKFSEKLQKAILRNNNSHVFLRRIYKKIIMPIIKNKQENTLDYLNELAMFDNKKFALCDVGWGGTIQKDIADYINRHHLAIQCLGLYYGTDQRAYELDEYYPATQFFPGYINSEKIGGSYSAVEFFLQDHSISDNEVIEKLGFETISINTTSRETILNFSLLFINFINQYGFLPWEIAPVSQHMARNFFTNPSRKFIKKLNKVNFSLDLKNDDKAIPLIPRISLFQYLSNKAAIQRLCQWEQALIKRNSAIFFLKKIKKIVRYIL